MADDSPDDLEPANTGPSCPFCGTNHRVSRDHMGGSRDQRVAGRLVWLCTRCWTVFQGGQGEWERCRETRQMVRARLEPVEGAA